MSARLHILQTERTNGMEWIRIAFSYGTLPASFMRHLPYTTFETEANDDCVLMMKQKKKKWKPGISIN